MSILDFDYDEIVIVIDGEVVASTTHYSEDQSN